MSTVAETRAQIESSIKSNLEDFLVLYILNKHQLDSMSNRYIILHKAFFAILMYGDIDMFINIIKKVS